MEKSFEVYRTNNNGPKTVPCGTPDTTHTLQSPLESRQKARIVQIDFSAALDNVNHQGILYRLSSVGIGGSV